MLTVLEMKPVAVANGEDALMELEKAAKNYHPFRLMLLDISLNGKMDGFDVAECIKQHPLLNTAVIILSKSQKASDRERFGQMGITKFFSKPFSQPDLIECMKGMMLLEEPIIPIDTASNVITHQQPVSGIPAEQYDILLVEDNVVNQEVALCILRKRGHNVSIANDGEEAVALFTQQRFDIILMDVQMPKMNGFEATERIRQLEKSKGGHILIIGLTASNMKGDKEKCLQAGMDHFISKPMRIKELMDAIASTS